MMLSRAEMYISQQPIPWRIEWEMTAAVLQYRVGIARPQAEAAAAALTNECQAASGANGLRIDEDRLRVR